MGHTYWNLLALAKVTFDHLLLLCIQSYRTQRADQQACAATDAALFINIYQRANRVTTQRAGKAGLNTGSIITMLAAQRKGDNASFLNAESR
jgi:hypothetical protein